jgi:hypothetical protein
MAKAKKTVKGKSGNAFEKALASIVDEEVAPPKIPVDRMIGEAKALAKVATANLDALVKVGLERAYVTTLEARADLLAGTCSRRRSRAW